MSIQIRLPHNKKMGDNLIIDDPLLLRYEFEPRMGFELYSLAINGEILKSHFSLGSIFQLDKKRNFFSNYLFSSDKHYLAISEYTSSSLKEGANFDLILFDLQEKKETKVSRVEDGSIEVKKFEGKSTGRKIIYHKNTDGFTREFEYVISDLKKWTKF